MTPFNYDRMRATAARLLDRFAQGTILLTRETPGAVDENEPWLPVEPTEYSEPLIGAIRGVSTQYVDGTTILATDLQVTCKPPAMGIQLGDKVTIDGKPVITLRVMPKPAAGLPAAFVLIVRG